MSSSYIASNWRLLNQENSNKSDNYGLSFDGTELINAGNSINIITANYSISIWLKFTSTNNLVVCEKGSNDELALQVGGTGNAGKISWFGGADYQVKIDETINDGEWHHVVCVAEGSASRMYLDGVLKTIGGNKIQASANTSDFHIGSRGGTIGIVGSISELTLFNYALSDGGVSLGETAGGQISTLYGSSSLGAGNPMALKPQPVAFYPLGDNSASNPLTQPNEAVEDASVFDFDGSSQSVILPNNTLSSITGDFAFSFWFNQSGNGSGSFGEGYLLGAYTGGGGAYSYLQIFSRSNDIWVNIKTSGGTFAYIRSGSTQFTNNTWNNVIVQRSGNDIEIYINGNTTPIKTQTISGDLRTDWAYSRLGQYLTSGYFNGEISNVAFWNSDQGSEISNIYNSGVPATSYTNTPTAWYKLDQSANWEADSSGDWQIPDAVSAYPQSFDFDGSDDFVNISSTSLGITSAISIQAWVKIPDGSTGGASPYIQSFIAEDDASTGNRNWFLGWRGTGYNDFYFFVFHNNGTVTSIYSNVGNINDGNWHHVVGTWDGTTDTNAFKLYVDNVVTQTTATNTSINSTSAVGTLMGAITEGAESRFFEGNLSNIMLWDLGLTSTQIETLYNNGVPLSTAIASDNLKLWAKLDNTATFSTNWSVPDASGNGNTGTSSGMTEQNLVNNNVSVLNGESSGMTSASLVLSDLSRNVPYDSYSFNFDSASSDKITGTGALISGNETRSFSLWYNITSALKMIPFSLGNPDSTIGGTNTQFAYCINRSNNATKAAIFGRGNDTATFTVPATNDGNWHHLVVTYDQSALNVYLDGNLVATPSLPSSNYATNDGFSIGNWSVGDRPFNGKLSNISVFNEALTSTEVLKLYSNGVPQNLTNFNPQPVAFYPLGSNSFWNGSQWTVRDMIGSNDGTGQNIGIDGLVGDSPRSSANGVGTNNSIPENLVGTTKWSELNSWSINMSSEARTTDVP